MASWINGWGNTRTRWRHTDRRSSAPDNLAIQAQLVRLLVRMKQFKQASDLAADLVGEHHANPESMALFREAYKGREAAMLEELKRIRKQRPGDYGIVVAIAQSLASAGRADDARKILQEELDRSRYDVMLVWRVFEYHQGRQESQAAHDCWWRRWRGARRRWGICNRSGCGCCAGRRISG